MTSSTTLFLCMISWIRKLFFCNTDLINLLWLLFLRFTRDACVNLCLVWCSAEQRPICFVRLIITMTSNPVFENNLFFRSIINYLMSKKFKGQSSCRESEIQNLTTLYLSFLISRTFGRGPTQFHTPLSSTNQFNTNGPLLFSPKIPQFNSDNPSVHTPLS